MLNKVLCYVQGWLGVRHYLRIPKSYMRLCSVRSQASDWHTYAIQRRPWRPHVCVPCLWITQTLPRSAHIFEAGCGSGANLLWLRQEGFSHLGGNDISPSAIHMCRLLSQYADTSLSAYVDDALQPKQNPRGVDALLSVNWLYHIAGASLDQLFAVYKTCLKPKGYIVFDVISSAYNSVVDNQYHTGDKHLPVENRRPSEYTFRMSPDEVQHCAHQHGFAVVRQKKLRAWPPRIAYMVQNCA